MDEFVAATVAQLERHLPNADEEALRLLAEAVQLGRSEGLRCGRQEAATTFNGALMEANSQLDELNAHAARRLASMQGMLEALRAKASALEAHADGLRVYPGALQQARRSAYQELSAELTQLADSMQP